MVVHQKIFTGFPFYGKKKNRKRFVFGLKEDVFSLSFSFFFSVPETENRKTENKNRKWIAENIFAFRFPISFSFSGKRNRKQKTETGKRNMFSVFRFSSFRFPERKAKNGQRKTFSLLVVYFFLFSVISIYEKWKMETERGSRRRFSFSLFSSVFPEKKNG